jgi:hypothetical protein
MFGLVRSASVALVGVLTYKSWAERAVPTCESFHDEAGIVALCARDAQYSSGIDMIRYDPTSGAVICETHFPDSVKQAQLWPKGCNVGFDKERHLYYVPTEDGRIATVDAVTGIVTRSVQMSNFTPGYAPAFGEWCSKAQLMYSVERFRSDPWAVVSLDPVTGNITKQFVVMNASRSIDVAACTGAIVGKYVVFRMEEFTSSGSIFSLGAVHLETLELSSLVEGRFAGDMVVDPLYPDHIFATRGVVDQSEEVFLELLWISIPEGNVTTIVSINSGESAESNQNYIPKNFVTNGDASEMWFVQRQDAVDVAYDWVLIPAKVAGDRESAVQDGGPYPLVDHRNLSTIYGRLIFEAANSSSGRAVLV